MLVALLRYSIDERLNVAEKLLEFRSNRVHNGIAKKRINEIEQHQNLLQRHIQVTLIIILLINNTIIIDNIFRQHKKKMKI